MAHLTLSDRIVIRKMRLAGHTQLFIAQALDFHPSTISRELSRNFVTGRHYSAADANKRAVSLKTRPSVVSKLEEPALFKVVSEKLLLNWSAEQISGYLRRSGGDLQVSHQTIYAYLWSLDKNHAHRKAMRRKGRHDRKRKPGFITKQQADRVSIHDRPKVANDRRRIGDWELDLVVCKKGTGYLVTAVDRKTGYMLLGRTKTKRTGSVMNTIKKMFSHLDKKVIKTMTFDNGTEFYYHRMLTRWYGVKVYFADPYSSGQRGTNENTNGLLRQYFEKGMDYAAVTWQAMSRAAKLINERPRKRHGYQTPASLFK